MGDSLTALPPPQQNLKFNHLRPPFDGKAPIILLDDRGYRYPEQGMPIIMIQVGVVIEVRAVKMVQGSLALDQEADRLKVSRCHSALHQTREASAILGKIELPRKRLLLRITIILSQKYRMELMLFL